MLNFNNFKNFIKKREMYQNVKKKNPCNEDEYYDEQLKRNTNSLLSAFTKIFLILNPFYDYKFTSRYYKRTLLFDFIFFVVIMFILVIGFLYYLLIAD